MLSENIFTITLAVSLIAHTLVLMQHPDFKFLIPQKKDKKIELKYLKIATIKEEPAKTTSRRIEPLYKLPDNITLGKENKASLGNPNRKDMEDIFKKNAENFHQKSTFVKPSLIKTDTTPSKKRITLPPIEPEKMSNPTYMSYYQLIREKIRRAAYQNFVHTETGEVFISFVITNSGILKDIRLKEADSSLNQYLRQTALDSIKDAAPFPSFPKDLDYPQLSFNVIISFEVE